MGGLEASRLLRRMRLPHIRRVAPELLATARSQRWDPAEVLRALIIEEINGRDRSSAATWRTTAAFPTGKTFRHLGPGGVVYPCSHPTSPAHPRMGRTPREPRRVRPVRDRKSIFLEALGQTAIDAGRRVAWFSLETLGVLVRRHRADDSVTKAVGRILRAELIVVDDIGLLPVTSDAAEGLYRLVDAAYEKRSLAISSNLHPSGFDEIMPKTIAGATVDRLLHHAHLCVTTGDSIRLAQATTG
jgi:DNA replication protein DnaC